jgi:hypothetical protein
LAKPRIKPIKSVLLDTQPYRRSKQKERSRFS